MGCGSFHGGEGKDAKDAIQPVMRAVIHETNRFSTEGNRIG